MDFKMFSSPKTTLTAVLGLVCIVGYTAFVIVDGDPNTNVDWGVVIPSVIACAGFFFARDNDKSSEDVGIK